MSDSSHGHSDPGPSNMKLNMIWRKDKVRGRGAVEADTTLVNPLEEPQEFAIGGGKRQKLVHTEGSSQSKTPVPKSPTQPTAPETDKTETHFQFPNFLQQVDCTINSLLQKDSILHDLADQHHSGESCEAMLAFESGQGVRIYLKREDGSILPIFIKKTETVRGLMKRIQSETERELKIMKSIRKVNWRHVWRQNLLVKSEDKLKLLDCNAKLRDVGLVNNTEVRFVKRIREKKKKRTRLSK